MRKCLSTTKELRNVYVRYILNLLRDKYHVVLAGLSDDMGISKTYLNDFSNGNKGFGSRSLDKAEYFLHDLYGAILEYEIPQDDDELIAFLENIRDKQLDRGIQR